LTPNSTLTGRIQTLRAAFIIAVVAFVLAQVFASIHAVKYGDSPHEHFGQACVLSLGAPGGDKFVASAEFVFAAAVLTLWRVCYATPRLAPVLVHNHFAHPRGPPSR
jgi:hypothetical protein